MLVIQFFQWIENVYQFLNIVLICPSYHTNSWSLQTDSNFVQAKQEILDVQQQRFTLASEEYKRLSRLQRQWKASKTSRMQLESVIFNRVPCTMDTHIISSKLEWNGLNMFFFYGEFWIIIDIKSVGLANQTECFFHTWNVFSTRLP